MKSAICIIAAALSLALPVNARAEGHEDPVAERLHGAREAFLRTLAEARENLLHAYDKAGGAGEARKEAFLKTQPATGLSGSGERVEIDPYQLDAYTGGYLLPSGEILFVVRHDDKLFAGTADLPVVEIVPIDENSFVRFDNGLQYDFLMAQDGPAERVSIHATTETARRIDPSATHVIRIKAQVDGRSLLALRGNTAQWLHREHVVPGRFYGRVKPTVLNGTEWYPVWPDARGLENHDAWESDTFLALTPPLPRAEVPVKLVTIRARCPVYLREQPCAENDYTAILDFNDYHGACDDYVIELHFPKAEPLPAASRPTPLPTEAEQAAIPSIGLVAWYPFDGDARDRSGSGHHGEVHHSELTRDRFGRPDHAYSFLGNGNIMIDPPPRRTPNQPLTVSAWANYAGIAAGWLNNVIISQDDGVTRTFQLASVNRHLTYLVAGKQELYITSHVRANPHAWYHIATTFDGKQHKLYVDGAQVAAIAGDLPASNTQRFVIGSRDTDERWSYFNGALDDIRIYNRALTQPEAKALYHEGGFEPEPLTRAARLGRSDVVGKLIAEGADVDGRDREGCSALHYAVRRADREMVEFLLSRGANANLPTLTGDTPLHLAASQEKVEIAKLLLDKGAFADAANSLEQRPLHVAAAVGQTETARLLIERKAQVSPKDLGRQTPLHRAAVYGRREVAELLLANGADAGAVTRQCLPPFAYARERGHDELADLLDAKYQTSKRTVVAAYLAARPTLDGAIAPGEYGNAAPESEFFLLRSGGDGAPVRTRFQAAWDSERLYLAITAEEENAHAIVTPQRGRDGDIWKDDYLDIFIDTNHDLKSYFQFAANLNQEKYDARCGPDCPKWGDINWSSEWEVATKAGKESYVMELAFPFKELGALTPKPGEFWGLNIGRARSARTIGGNEQQHSQWSITPKDYHKPHYFGRLKFARDEAKGGDR